MSKNQVERILEIDKKVRSGSYPSKKDFVQQFEVSTKSIERDIYHLRDRLGAPIEYSYQKNGYYYTDDNYFLPGHIMTEGELFSFMMSKEMIGAMGESPLKNQLAKGLNRLADYLPERVKTDQFSALSRMTIITEGSGQITEKTWNLIVESLRQNKVLTFIYKAPSSNQDKEKIFHPYQMVSYRGLWYLIGLNPLKERIENFSIIRMKDIILRQEQFDFPSDFRIENYIDPEMGMYISEETYHIKILFYKWVAPYVTERKWHRTQKITEHDDGNITFEFQTNQLVQTAQWVMSWGDGALVIEPDELREQVKKTIQNMAKQYGGVENES